MTRGGPRPALAGPLIVTLFTLAEVALFDRLLFEGHAANFVTTAVTGVLAGTPVSKSWQHRLIGPAAVAAIGSLAPTLRDALRMFSALTVAAASALLYILLRRKGARPAGCVLAVIAFAVAHGALLYRLEYPWDGVDVLLFMAFGYWVSQGGRLAPLAPLLVVGTLNHETVLLVPLYYLIAPLTGQTPPARRQIAHAALALLLIGGAILALRELLYRGRPDLPGQVFETAAPIIGNHIHVTHNLRQLLVDNWRTGAGLVSAIWLLTVVALASLWVARTHVTAAVWTLCALATVVTFGYVNETRHYLLLAAFWFAYGWPVSWGFIRPMTTSTPGTLANRPSAP